MNNSKKEKIWHHEMGPQVVGVQYAAGELQRNIFRKNEETEAQWEKNTQLWIYLWWK